MELQLDSSGHEIIPNPMLVFQVNGEKKKTQLYAEAIEWKPLDLLNYMYCGNIGQ